MNYRKKCISAFPFSSMHAANVQLININCPTATSYSELLKDVIHRLTSDN